MQHLIVIQKKIAQSFFNKISRYFTSKTQRKLLKLFSIIIYNFYHSILGQKSTDHAISSLEYFKLINKINTSRYHTLILLNQKIFILILRSRQLIQRIANLKLLTLCQSEIVSLMFAWDNYFGAFEKENVSEEVLSLAILHLDSVFQFIGQTHPDMELALQLHINDLYALIASFAELKEEIKHGCTYRKINQTNGTNSKLLS